MADEPPDLAGATRTVTVSGGGEGPPSLPAVAALPAGVSVGRFVVLGPLGQGGMGTLYKAYDPELDRSVALKLVRGETEDPLSQERLLREAKGLARLSHPNVVALYEAGAFEGRVYLAMELVEGGTLKAWLAAEPRSLAAILEAFLAAGEGLAAAHAAGLVHRDFKPDNVLVGADGRVRVVDFGLVRASEGAPPRIGARPEPGAPPSVPRRLDGSGSVTVPSTSAPSGSSTPGPTGSSASERRSGSLADSITRVGAVMGTPRYMAPEQHMGMVADGRADQFSFAVALYEALYGAMPFRGTGREGFRMAVVTGQVAPPPEGSRVPRWQRRVLLRALSPQPGARYDSMGELLHALRNDPGRARRMWLGRGALVVATALPLVIYAQLRDRRAQACETSSTRLAGVWDEGRRAAVSKAFLATGAPFAQSSLQSVERTLDAYASAWQRMHTDTCLATRVRHEQSEELLDLRMHCLTERRDRLAAQVEVFAAADREVVQKAAEAAQQLEPLGPCADAAGLRAMTRPPSDAATRGRLAAVDARVARAAALQLGTKAQEGLPVAEEAAKAAEEIGYAPTTARALVVLGELQDDAGKYEEAATTFHRAAVAAQGALDDVTLAEAWTHLGWVASERLSRYAEADHAVDYAEATIRRAPAASHLLPGTLRNRGVILYREGHIERALATSREALAWIDAHEPRQTTLESCLLSDLADALRELSRFEEASVAYQRSIDVTAAAYGGDHPELAKRYGNMALLLIDMGEPERALAAEEKARTLWERSFGPVHPDCITHRNIEGDALFELGRYGEAAARYRLALDIADKNGMNQTRNVGYALTSLAHALVADHKPEGALEASRAALALYDHLSGPDHPDMPFAAAALGMALVDLGRADEAVAPLEHGLRVQEHKDGEAEVRGVLRLTLARALAHDPRQRGRARELATRAREDLLTLGKRQLRNVGQAEALLVTLTP